MRRFLLLAVILSARIVHAQSDLSPLHRPSRPMIEAARQHYASGTRFFEEGSWDAALVEFTAGWQLSGERDFLFNSSWTHEKAGRTREALDYAERHLAASRGTEDEERAAKRVAFLKAKYGQPATESASTGQALELPVVPPTAQKAASEATAAPSSEGKAKPPAPAIGLLAGGGALALGGIGCLAGAWSTAQHASSADLTFAEGSGLIDRGHTLNATGIALTVAGGALVVGGVTWAVLARRGLK